MKLTKQALDKLKQELEERIEAREEISENIKKTREMGDLRENSAYHEAKDKQGFNEGRIQELKALIKDAEIVEESHSKNKVGLGSEVELEMLNNGNKVQFKIVSFNEADPTNKKISDQSPLGKALLDSKLGETIQVKTPKSMVKYKILKIN